MVNMQDIQHVHSLFFQKSKTFCLFPVFFKKKSLIFNMVSDFDLTEPDKIANFVNTWFKNLVSVLFF